VLVHPDACRPQRCAALNRGQALVLVVELVQQASEALFVVPARTSPAVGVSHRHTPVALVDLGYVIVPAIDPLLAGTFASIAPAAVTRTCSPVVTVAALA